MYLRQREPPRRCQAHLAWVRAYHPCAVALGGHGGPLVAHHVRTGTNGGMGMKPGDEWAVSLCTLHHLELHQCGPVTFEARYCLCLRDLAVQLASRSPYLHASASRRS